MFSEGAAVWATACTEEALIKTVTASAAGRQRVQDAMTGLDEEIESIEVIRWSRVFCTARRPDASA